MTEEDLHKIGMFSNELNQFVRDYTEREGCESPEIAIIGMAFTIGTVIACLKRAGQEDKETEKLRELVTRGIDLSFKNISRGERNFINRLIRRMRELGLQGGLH